jgi:hypothetical protein
MKKGHTILVIDRNEVSEVAHDVLDLISEDIETSLKNPARNELPTIRAAVFH